MAKKLIERLQNIRKHASLEPFAGPGFGEQVQVIHRSGPPGENAGKTVDACQYIKDKLRIYLESWVLPQLDEIIQELEMEREKNKSR